MNKLAKKMIYGLGIAAACLSAPALAQSSNELSPFREILTMDTREMSQEEYSTVVRQLNAMGSIPMTRLSDKKTVAIKPGSVTPEQGLDFIPDDDEAISIYLGMIDGGALPFAAIFLTNQVLFDSQIDQ